MVATLMNLVGRTRAWGLCGALFLAATGTASAQYGGYGGYGGGGYGGFGGYGGGYGGYGGYGGFGGIGPGGFGGSFGGYPLQSSLNAYNLGYGNTLGIGLVPPAYVGTGTAGLGPVGIGGINPLFGLGLSPLAIQYAVAEQTLRPRPPQNPGFPRGSAGTSYRIKLSDLTIVPNAVTTAPR